MITGLFKDARFDPFSNLHRCISLVVVCCFVPCLGWRLSPIFFFFFSRVFLRVYRCVTLAISVSASQTMLTGLFEDARFGPFSNLRTCISLVENYRFVQCLGWRFSPISTFFFFVSSRAFREAPQSQFRCRDPNQCLPNILKMLLLALPKIYTSVFHLWMVIDLDSAQSL